MESPWPCLLAGLQRDFLNLIFMETNTACTTDPFCWHCGSRNVTQKPGKWTTFILRGRNNSGIKISGPLVHLSRGVGGKRGFWKVSDGDEMHDVGTKVCGEIDWWLDWYSSRLLGKKGGCNGGERRAGKAKWIMRMWGDRWDVQGCLPPPPHAAAAAVADGAAVGWGRAGTPVPALAITVSQDWKQSGL